MNILITGGASGFGESITKNLARNKANKIYFTYCKSSENAKRIEFSFTNTKGIYCNFKNADSIQSLLGQMESLHLEVLVNNALTGIKKDYFHKIEADDFVQSYMTNILPVIKITQKAILIFRKQKSGKIITIISSYISNKPAIGLSEYLAQKNYLLSLSKSWVVENAKFNITCNCVSPAFMQTPLNADTDERVIEEIINNHPLKRLLTPDEAAESVNYFINAQKHVNGVNMIINSPNDIV